ncbi:unnamed protein product [Didymodactylos carnosus]|uniref:Uncharacterized protein n=1 Tax=Didymodactylos carnosus TaxID=1234261 RepID=A0A816AGP9_9BILA|nr:unnamed protein product [Didymodactylos carnosus]CAF4470145.1 unnamed protein product [Didymodactylos carnosus]
MDVHNETEFRIEHEPDSQSQEAGSNSMETDDADGENNDIYPQFESRLAIEDFTKLDLATVLIMFKLRYRITIKGMNSLLNILKLLKVPNVPADYLTLVKLLRTTSTATSPPFIKCTFCPQCELISRHTTNCTNEHCENYKQYKTKIQQHFIEYAIEHQIQSILERETHLTFPTLATTNADVKRDIYDGERYQELLRAKPGRFLTLSLNADGVQMKHCGDVSLWLIIFCINEIHQKQRFQIQNSIIGGLWPGPKKPSQK